MNYSNLADTLFEPLVQYILTHHREEITEIYSDCIDEFLFTTLGELTPQARKKLTKHLMKKLIQ